MLVKLLRKTILGLYMSCPSLRPSCYHGNDDIQLPRLIYDSIEHTIFSFSLLCLPQQHHICFKMFCYRIYVIVFGLDAEFRAFLNV